MGQGPRTGNSVPVSGTFTTDRHYGFGVADQNEPTKTNQTKTIPEFFAEAPDTDSMEIWGRFWDILGGLRDRVEERFELTPHPSSAQFGNWRSGSFEGSLNTYTGPEAEWVVHSWIGNRSQGILDMNFQVWLGPHVEVPHLVVVFGTIPKVFHYSDLTPRKELATNVEYMKKYYEPANEDFLEFRGDDRFTWSVSHGAYMRSIISPVGHSYTAERTDDVIESLEKRVGSRFDRWLGWVDSAEPVPEAERADLSARDHYLRENIYRLDPMNALASRFMKPDMVEALIEARFGAEQLAGR